jgi:hypothetical protein
MKRLLPLTLLLTGCGGYVQPPTALPNIKGPQKTLTAPTVVLIGDSLMSSWLTPQVLTANPSWVAQTSPEGVEETSAEILTRFPAAVALDPQIIVLQAGTWSMGVAGPSWECNWTASQTLDNPCDDISAMVTQAQAAGIYVIVCTIPPWDVGPLATQIDTTTPEPQTYRYNIGSFNYALLDFKEPANFVPIGFVDVYGLINDMTGSSDPWWEAVTEDDVEYFYDPTYTVDGVNPNSAGQQLVLAAVQTEIETSGIRGKAR